MGIVDDYLEVCPRIHQLKPSGHATNPLEALGCNRESNPHGVGGPGRRQSVKKIVNAGQPQPYRGRAGGRHQVKRCFPARDLYVCRCDIGASGKAKPDGLAQLAGQAPSVIIVAVNYRQRTFAVRRFKSRSFVASLLRVTRSLVAEYAAP